MHMAVDQPRHQGPPGQVEGIAAGRRRPGIHRTDAPVFDNDMQPLAQLGRDTVEQPRVFQNQHRRHLPHRARPVCRRAD